MKKPEKDKTNRLLIALVICSIYVLGLIPIYAFAQNSTENAPIIIEAESGKLGSGFSIVQDADVNYITAKANFAGQASPDDAIRIVYYDVTFKYPGYYKLFARVRVGTDGFSDDSFFSGKGFGQKVLNNGDDWVLINGLAAAGFSSSADVVEEMGVLGSEIWKWVNISSNFFSGTSSKEAFLVNADNLTQTFQIASREDGLAIDKFAFGNADLYYTVESLDKWLPGSSSKPNSATSKFYQGPPLADGLPKFLGNVMASDNIFANYWNQITPGNEGKWASIAGTSDSTKWNWTGLDAIYNYAKNHNLIFKDHTLIWGNQQPSWISSLDQTQQLKYIETWIRKVGQRYPGIDMIDVVNEPLVTHNPPDGVNGRANYKNALGGNGSTGWDWVINSFKLARKYLPKAKLLINDYGIINDNNSTTTYLTIINLLKERGLIDGIGVQGHRFEFENANITTLKYNLDRLAATGLPIYISEMDLGNLNNSGTPDDNQQLQLYQKIFPVLWDHPGVKGITLWGYLEGEMWQSTCYLVLKDGTWRPAMQWISQYIKANVTTEIEKLLNVEASDIRLEQNYPNPFVSTTKITFSISKPQYVILKIYNIQGREVATLVNENLEPGNYSVRWDANNSLGSTLESGIYYYQLVANRTILNKKMIMLR